MTNRISRTISDETLNRIIQIESAGNPNAKAPTSSAAGLGQFISGTWAATVRKHRPDLAASPPSRVGTDTAALQIEMLARFTEDNARALGAGFTDGDLYLAHFLGLGDARKLFRAPSAAEAASVVSPAAVKANKSILAGKTCGQVRAWAQQSMEQRWAKAGRPDWVGKYGAAIKPPAEPAKKPAPPPTVAAGGAAAGGVVVAGASQQGWGALEWSIAIAVVVALVAAGVFAWRWWKARQERQEEIGAAGLAAVGNALYVNPTTGSDANDGLSPDSAFSTMQKAVDVASKPAARRKAPAKPKKRAKPAKKRAAR